MKEQSGKLTYRKIFVFWLPLAATWLMMSVEGPFLAAVIARLADPKFNLAAYGVAFSFALIIEAPVIMMMSASTALVQDKNSFLKLRNFTYVLSAVITILMILFIIPSIFYFFTIDLIGLPQNIADLTHTATLILLPWPGAIGYRRFYQGILIRNNLTHRVAYGTVLRLSSMAVTAMFLYFQKQIAGVMVGAAALSMGVIVEGIFTRFMVASTLKSICTITEEKEEISYKKIYSFYYPLALTSILALGVHPLVTFFVGQSRMAIESFAVLPVISSLVFVFRAVGLSYQEVGISLVGKYWENYKPVRNFAFFLVLSVTVTISLIAFTPLAKIWFFDISGLSMQLTIFSFLPLQILTILPGLSVILSFQRAVLVNGRNTSPVTMATMLEVIGITISMLITIRWLNLVGAVAAAISFIFGRLAANLYLVYPYRKSIIK